MWVGRGRPCGEWCVGAGPARHVWDEAPSTQPAHTCPHFHLQQPPTNNRIDFKTDQNGRVATMQLYIGLLRLEDSQFSLSAWASPGCGAALEHRIPDTKKQEFPATTILMCFIINYYFSINGLWLTVRQYGEAQSPFLGPWGHLLAMDKKVPKILGFMDKRGPKS